MADGRRVASTLVHQRWWVSTTFVGVDLSSGISEIPLVYETVIFDRRDDSFNTNVGVLRYPTRDAARRGHNDVVKRLKGGWIPTFT